MKKNSRNLDHLIGTLWISKFEYDKKFIKMIIGVDYQGYNSFIVEVLNGPYAGDTGGVLETDFFNYHKEIK
jgi:hypothetical protein